MRGEGGYLCSKCKTQDCPKNDARIFRIYAVLNLCTVSMGCELVEGFIAALFVYEIVLAIYSEL